MAHFRWMKVFYFRGVGWKPEAGIPLPHTLQTLDLGALNADLEREGFRRP